jgi:hypothetical protein
MTLALQARGGRYPHRLAPYHPKDIRATLEQLGDRVLSRIEDLNHADRWEELWIDTAALLAELTGQVRAQPTGQP